MQDKWKDLIPFYVADTLSDRDKQALEAYLLKCGDPCQDEIDEWRVIASATWQHVNTNNLDLPPLSPHVLQEVAKDAPFRASNKVITSNEFHHNTMDEPRATALKEKRQQSQFPLTMVAAFMTVVIFGGILLSQLTPNDLEPETLIQITNANDATGVTVTEDFGGLVGIQPTNPNSSGILATPTQLAPRPSATVTPMALPTQNPITPINTQPANIAAISQDGACIIRNNTQGALTTYRNASFDAEPVNVMGQGVEAHIDIVFNGWYMLAYGSWVSGDHVTVIGGCSQVWTATPTAIGDSNGGTVDDGVPNCIVRNDSINAVQLYQWADLNSPANGRMEFGEEATVYVGQNGWYQVYYAQWVNGADVTLIGEDCNNLWIPTPTYQPGATATPSPLSNSVAVVTSDNALLRGSPAEIGLFVQEVVRGTNLSVTAHNGLSGAQRWYLVHSPQGQVGWISISDVDIIPNDVDVFPAATVPFIPSATPTRIPVTPVIENWRHITTITEHGCGGTVGEQTTISVQLERLGTVINLVYPDSQVTYTLNEVTPNAFYGIFGKGPTIQISLSFTSSTTYTATEIITHQSGCVVRSTWAGTK